MLWSQKILTDIPYQLGKIPGKKADITLSYEDMEESNGKLKESCDGGRLGPDYGEGQPVSGDHQGKYRLSNIIQ